MDRIIVPFREAGGDTPPPSGFALRGGNRQARVGAAFGARSDAESHGQVQEIVAKMRLVAMYHRCPPSRRRDLVAWVQRLGDDGCPITAVCDIVYGELGPQMAEMDAAVRAEQEERAARIFAGESVEGMSVDEQGLYEAIGRLRESEQKLREGEQMLRESERRLDDLRTQGRAQRPGSDDGTHAAAMAAAQKALDDINGQIAATDAETAAIASSRTKKSGPCPIC